MNLILFLTYVLTTFLMFSNKKRYSKNTQLNQLKARSSIKLSIYLFLANLKRDIFSIITVLLIVIVSPIGAVQKLLLLLVYASSQFVYRTFQYCEQQFNILVLCAPFIFSTLLNNNYLLSLCALSTSFSLISSAFNIIKRPVVITNKTNKDSSYLVLIGLSSLLISFGLSYSSLSKWLSLSQILPIITLVLTTYIENLITSNKDFLIRYQSYFSLYRLRVGKVSTTLLGLSIQNKLKVGIAAYAPMLSIYIITSKDLLNSLALICVLLLVLYSNLDLLTYHYLCSSSIVYANSVTRFIMVQIPNFIAFSYIIFASVQNQITSSTYLDAFKPLHISFIVFSSILCLLYHFRLMKIVTTKKIKHSF